MQRLGARYVATHDEQTLFQWPPESQVVQGKFPTMAVWAGRDTGRYFETYYERTESGERLPRLVYYPDYYQSIFARLYLYGGRAAVPDNTTWVVHFAERTESGWRFKELLEVERFHTHLSPQRGSDDPSPRGPGTDEDLRSERAARRLHGVLQITTRRMVRRLPGDPRLRSRRLGLAEVGCHRYCWKQ